MKPVFPSIKKNVKSFLYDEDGLITKDSLIKLGVLSAGVIAASKPVVAIEGPFEITCEDTLEAGDYTMQIYVDDSGASGDMMDEPKCLNLVNGYFQYEDRIEVINGMVPDPSTWKDDYGGDSSGRDITVPVIFDRPLHRHANGLSMSAEDDVLEANHSHNLEPVCTEYPRFEVWAKCFKGTGRSEHDCSDEKKKGLHLEMFEYNEYGDLVAESGKIERCVD